MCGVGLFVGLVLVARVLEYWNKGIPDVAITESFGL